jgi:hypothetical protein
MKKQFLVLIAIAAFTTVLTTSAFGQVGKTTDANVKFDFQIGDRLYPAGNYRIESISHNILKIRNLEAANKNQVIVSTLLNDGKGETPRLVFQKYGEIYFLSNIFLGTEHWGYSIRPSRRQREIEKNLALASLKKVEVPLASK